VNGPDFDSQPAQFQFVNFNSTRHSGGFPINPQSDDNVTIMLDFPAKAARMKPRRFSGVAQVSKTHGRVIR
jgi:hypothetical protein